MNASYTKQITYICNLNKSSFDRILEQDENFAEDLSEGEPGSGGQIDFEEDSCAQSPTSSVPSAEDESLLDDSYTREIMFNNYNDVILETDCNQPSSCINPLISEISVPEIQREKFQPPPVPKISSITALPLSQSPCRRDGRIRMFCVVCHLLDRLQGSKHQTGKTKGQERTEQTNPKDGKAQQLKNTSGRSRRERPNPYPYIRQEITIRPSKSPRGDPRNPR